MSHRAGYLAIAGLIMVAASLFALRFPVYLDDYDRYGWQISCGSGYTSSLSQAEAGGAEFVDRCHTALTTRRAVLVPVGALGAVLLTGALLRLAATGRR